MAQTAGTRRTVRLLGVTAGMICLGMVFAVDASAQFSDSNSPASTSDSLRRRLGDAAARQQKHDVAPDTLPGAKARSPVAPPTKSATDMSPNDAMFDAINRGDIAMVKDALSRGADLRAHNILGMTPLELSVDLGRNDISFLLLSMRGEGGSAPPPVGARATAQHRLGPDLRTAETKPAAARGRGVPHQPPVAPRTVATPKMFANDGGTPVPNAGFLGFDSRGGTN